MSDPIQENAAVPYNPPEENLNGLDLVLRRHQDMLLSKPGVTGVAVGRSPVGDPAIVVYLLDQKYRAGLPAALDGHPVVTQVTGTIQAQDR